MQHSDTHFVLRPDSDFFRYFGNPTGKAAPATAAATSAPGNAANASGAPK